jgi:hypothetical protein
MHFLVLCSAEEYLGMLFDVCRTEDGKASVKVFFEELQKTGIRSSDPRLQHMMRMLETLKPLTLPSVELLKLDLNTFKAVMSENIVLVTKAFRNQMVIPAFDFFCETITEIYNIVRPSCCCCCCCCCCCVCICACRAVREQHERAHRGHDPAAGAAGADEVGRVGVHGGRPALLHRPRQGGLHHAGHQQAHHVRRHSQRAGRGAGAQVPRQGAVRQEDQRDCPRLQQ